MGGGSGPLPEGARFEKGKGIVGLKTSKLTLKCEQDMLWPQNGTPVFRKEFTQTVDINEGDEWIEFTRDDVDYIIRYRAKRFRGEKSSYDFIGDCEIETCGGEDAYTGGFRATIVKEE